MLVKFCGGFIDPERVEAVMPGNRSGYMLITRGRNIVMFEAEPHEVVDELINVGLYLPEETASAN